MRKVSNFFKFKLYNDFQPIPKQNIGLIRKNDKKCIKLIKTGLNSAKNEKKTNCIRLKMDGDHCKSWFLTNKKQIKTFQKRFQCLLLQI